MSIQILLTNDDGVHARGLRLLAAAFEAADLGEVWVVAPETEQSAMSHAISLGKPLRIRRIEERRFSVTGTPTDCAYIGINHVMNGDLPTLVVSGVNHGANLGTDVTYSGTVGAAMEGCALGAAAIAVSSLGISDDSLTRAARFAVRIARKVLEDGLPQGVLLNLNVPEGWPDGGPWRLGTLGVRNYGRVVDERRDPRGGRYYWIGGPPITHDDIPGSDCNLVRDGLASVTPVHMDLTHHPTMDRLQGWLESVG